MCYTGKCRYECGGGDSVGDCKLQKAIYLDCLCIENEMAQEPKNSPYKQKYLQQLKDLENYENSNKRLWFISGKKIPTNEINF